MENNSKVPAHIFNSNAAINNYLNTVSLGQFQKDAQVTIKHFANNGIVKEEISKIKNTCNDR